MSKGWLFFDIGSTLVDESECYQKRCEDIVRESSVSIEEFQKKAERIVVFIYIISCICFRYPIFSVNLVRKIFNLKIS